MAEQIEFDHAQQPRYKVELHVHLDGSVRLKTIWELAEKKGIKLGVETLDDLCHACCIHSPAKSLADFLKPFCLYYPVIIDDPEAIERIAYEFCEDASAQGVLYSEVRYAPHLLSTRYGFAGLEQSDSALTAREVVMCVNRGLSRGSADFNLTVRSILCCFRQHPEWSSEILDLCVEFRNKGVVGIDLAGDEAKIFANDIDIEIFKRASQLGVHRTVHAGEAGPAINVYRAVFEMSTERIGHGYHVVDDPTVYDLARSRSVHFEACPYSSCLTNSVPMDTPKHPIVRFAEDGVNFSISRDDPTLIQKTLDEEYQFLRERGLTDVHFVKANFNAAKSCFLPDDEKSKLLLRLEQIYGIQHSRSDESKIVLMSPSATSLSAPLPL